MNGDKTKPLEELTLRDYFASHCPSDICNTEDEELAAEFLGRKRDGTIHEQVQWNMEVEAKLRYAYADAMLAERNK